MVVTMEEIHDPFHIAQWGDVLEVRDMVLEIDTVDNLAKHMKHALCEKIKMKS